MSNFWFFCGFVCNFALFFVPLQRLNLNYYDYISNFNNYSCTIWRWLVVSRDVSLARFWRSWHFWYIEYGRRSWYCLSETNNAMGMGRTCDTSCVLATMRYCYLGIYQEQSNGQDGTRHQDRRRCRYAITRQAYGRLAEVSSSRNTKHWTLNIKQLTIWTLEFLKPWFWRLLPFS